MSADAPPLSTPLDFLTERDDATGSWTRADPQTALIERLNRYEWLVTLRDGTPHRVALAREHGAFVGRCDCDGYQYHDGPCAHLCTLRKAAFVNIEDIRGETVRILASDGEREAIPDGGREIVGAGHDGREFGRPEGQL